MKPDVTAQFGCVDFWYSKLCIVYYVYSTLQCKWFLESVYIDIPNKMVFLALHNSLFSTSDFVALGTHFGPSCNLHTFTLTIEVGRYFLLDVGL